MDRSPSLSQALPTVRPASLCHPALCGAAGIGYPVDMNNFARRLRRDSTDAERLLWSRLRGRQLTSAKFRRQHQRSSFIVDFFCPEVMLIVEVDGGQHNPALAVDGVRARRLRASGCKLLRFWNHDVLNDLEPVLEAIAAAIEDRRRLLRARRLHDSPLPAGEGGETVGRACRTRPTALPS